MNGTGDGETNRPTINWVTRTLCTLGLVLGGTVAALPWFDKAVPSELNTLAGIVIGGLLSMLTKSTPTPAGPTPVNVTNKPSDPVPVDPA